MTPVYAIETEQGWVLQTADDARDVLVGPVDTESELKKLAKECELKIISTQVLSFTTELIVRKRKPGDLFRIGGYWYRLRKHNGSGSTVTVVGLGKDAELAGDAVIDEISVMSKQ